MKPKVNKLKVIVTLGPSTNKESDLRRLKLKGIDFVRINMSHSTIEELRYFISLAKKVGLEFILDTEGGQIRTGDLPHSPIHFSCNEAVYIGPRKTSKYSNYIILKPEIVFSHICVGDIIYIDNNSMAVQVIKPFDSKDKFLIAKVLYDGQVYSNKAVIIHNGISNKIVLPTLSEKDLKGIKIGLKEGVKFIAASYVHSEQCIREIKNTTKGKMQIIAKIETKQAVLNLDKILETSDYLLIDRGDLSKEIDFEKIPYLQKMIIHKAGEVNKEVIVATNLLESMVKNNYPTKAEVQDVVNTIIDGADGLTLSAETAIGDYPHESVNVLNRIVRYSTALETRIDFKTKVAERNKELMNLGQIVNNTSSTGLISPHGGELIDRIIKDTDRLKSIKNINRIKLNFNQQMDLEQIAIGAYSPLTGFQGEEEFHSVLDNMRLSNGLIWPFPIVLDVDDKTAEKHSIGDNIYLIDNENKVCAILNLEEKYFNDKNKTIKNIYGNCSDKHPGVKITKSMGSTLLAGKISLINRPHSFSKEYELTPLQIRRLFDTMNWSKVAGFHTRNVPHLGHETIHKMVFNDYHCDGLLIHPVVGNKKPGDFNSKIIFSIYEELIKRYYPRNKILLSAFSTFSRYAGPREALFTAICRQNFGCSHFVVGRDHTGVGEYYHPDASHKIFEKLSDLKIEIIKIGEIYYSKAHSKYIEEKDNIGKNDQHKLSISGTEIRKILERGEVPPHWMMRPEISAKIRDIISNDKDVYVSK